MRKAWSFEVSECPSRGCWKQFLLSRPYEHSQWGGGGIYPGVKCPPTQPSCILPFLCNDQRDWEEPGHLKFLNALHEDAGNSFSCLVPMNIVYRGRGGQSTPGKVSPPPQPSCILSFLCNDQWDWEEISHLKFLNALQEDAGNSFCYFVPMNIVNRGGGTIYPGVKCPPPPSTLMYAFIFM